MEPSIQSYETKFCRLCNSDNLTLVLKLNDSALCDDYLKVKVTQRLYPLIVNLCKECEFVQLSHVVPPEIIYENYIYFTESSPGLKSHFKNYADEIVLKLGLSANNLIVDIGSNDGTLLKYLKALGQNVVGIEPSVPASNVANRQHIKTYNNFFDRTLVNSVLKSEGQADVITINNLFANVVNLNNFIENVIQLLSVDGVLIIESSYLIDMLDNMVFDFIYHEHLSYLSVKPLQRWFLGHGLRLFDIQEGLTKGGSLRYFVAKENSKWKEKPSVKKISVLEPQGKVLEKKFSNFNIDILNMKLKIHDVLKPYVNKKVVGYGASATTTTLISYFEIQNYLAFLVDDNKAKIGRFSPGFHIPVFDPEVLVQSKPDLIIIFAWRFLNKIHPKIKELGIPILVPLPSVSII